MKVWTSYYGGVGRLRKAGLLDGKVLVQISNTKPRWWKGTLPMFKPFTPPLWSIRLDEMRFRPVFERQLRRLDVNVVMKQLEEISGGRDVVLLCYERPDEFCHRHQVREWLRDNGIDSEELVVRGGVNGDGEAVQLAMF